MASRIVAAAVIPALLHLAVASASRVPVEVHKRVQAAFLASLCGDALALGGANSKLHVHVPGSCMHKQRVVSTRVCSRNIF